MGYSNATTKTDYFQLTRIYHSANGFVGHFKHTCYCCNFEIFLADFTFQMVVFVGYCTQIAPS